MSAVRDERAGSAVAADPLASLRVDATAIADLAFGSLSMDVTAVEGRHLAFLSVDSLELDLADPLQRNLGDYELIEKIGEGGMGVVYRAHQMSLDRDVAVKLLAAGPWASKEFIERFRREAQNAARMQHPNIVAIYEVGSAEELHFFSMRLVRGGSLADLLKCEHKLPALRAAQLLRTVAEAVDYAHRLGVLHLDLKPANVLLDDNGNPHVADFGLARRLEQGLAADNHEISGTPSYMAPEQCTAGAQRITPATDIWGLGAILYELITGQPPFLGDTPQETLQLVVDGHLRSPRRYTAELPRDLEAIIEKCMARDVRARYASARELADDLGRFLTGFEVKARPLSALQRVARFAQREPKLAAMALLAFGVLVIGVLATTQQWRRADTNAQRAETNAAQAQANAAQSNERLWQERRDAALRLMSDGKGFEALAPLADNIEEQERAGHIDPASIERREIGMIEQQGITLIDRMIVPGAPVLTAGLSPDGSLLALGFGDMSVRWYDTATLSERGHVDVGGLPTSDGEERVPRVLRFVDDHKLRVTLEWLDYLAAPAGNDTYLVDLDAAKVVEFPPQFGALAQANFSADARHALLYHRDGGEQLWQVEPWQPLGPMHVLRPLGRQEFLGRGARFAATKGDDFQWFLGLRDPHTAALRRDTGMHAAVTAWAESGDGKWFAAGDSRGHLYLIDTSTHAMRQLPTAAGREFTWISFSEDDAWLAGTRWEGTTFAFDVASGEPIHGGQIQDGFEPHEVAISHRERLIVVSGLGETALWRLPDTAPNPMGATRLLTAPTRAARAGTNTTASALGARLLATAGLDGEVRLWRLPTHPQTPAKFVGRGDLNLTPNPPFDGQHLADVAWDHLRVAALDGATATPWQRFPQPVAFAESLDSGKTLVAVSGHELHVFDNSEAAPQRRFPAVDLPANPQRATVERAGGFVLLAFGANTGNGFEERLIAYDLHTGNPLAETRIRGPLRLFELSTDGARLLTVGPARGETEVFDARTLHRIGVYAHEPSRPVMWAAFVPGTDDVWLMARDAEDALANDVDLLAWNARSGAVSERRHLAGLFPIGVSVVAGTPFLAARDRDIFDAGGAGEKAIPMPLHAESAAVFAQSHDGRLFAHVFGRDVVLYDTASRAPIGPPLPSHMHNINFPFQLAFADDDRHLLARPPNVVWSVGADPRPLADLRAQARVLMPARGGEQVLALPTAEERALLRRADPGPPPPLEQRPAPPTARLVSGHAIPARNPSTSPLLIDLTAAYNRAGDFIGDLITGAIPGMTGRMLGTARLDGVDYDMRGGIAFSPDQRNQSRASGIPIPAQPIAAFHILLVATLATSIDEVRDYAYVRLHYRDGTTATLPIRTQREVPGQSDHDQPTPIGLVRGDFLRLIGASRQELTSNPRLPNPHPEKLIATLDLEPAGTWALPIFFAITAEPVITDSSAGATLSKP